MAKLPVGIIGATGYLGQEVIKILLRHPQAEVSYLAYSQDTPKPISELIPAFNKIIKLDCKPFNSRDAAHSADMFFLALPAAESTKIAPKLLKSGKKVIDLSNAFRLKKGIIYGLPELYRTQIKKARFVANPGCYPTSIILGCAPIMREKLVKETFIVADSKSGISGAGRKLQNYLLFCESDENIAPYNVNSHQHIPEISRHLSRLSGRKIDLIFVPQIVPMKRGILSDIYVRLTKRVSLNTLKKIYKNFYRNEQFVRIKDGDTLPQTKDVCQTNFCDIAIRVDNSHSLAIIISCLDNLLKGGAGQAVQNMNIMYNFKETEGLL